MVLGLPSALRVWRASRRSLLLALFGSLGNAFHQ
jgi:hypothetical protein